MDSLILALTMASRMPHVALSDGADHGENLVHHRFEKLRPFCRVMVLHRGGRRAPFEVMVMIAVAFMAGTAAAG